jgi:hypothetical protein
MTGIPINDLVNWNEKLRNLESAAINIAPELNEDAVQNDNIEIDELAFIKSMEKDFALQAESLLESLNLTHLRVGSHKKSTPMQRSLSRTNGLLWPILSTFY